MLGGPTLGLRSWGESTPFRCTSQDGDGSSHPKISPQLVILPSAELTLSVEEEVHEGRCALSPRSSQVHVQAELMPEMRPARGVCPARVVKPPQQPAWTPAIRATAARPGHTVSPRRDGDAPPGLWEAVRVPVWLWKGGGVRRVTPILTHMQERQEPGNKNTRAVKSQEAAEARRCASPRGAARCRAHRRPRFGSAHSGQGRRTGSTSAVAQGSKEGAEPRGRLGQ